MVPVGMLWGGFTGKVSVIVRGYIDESYDGRRPPRMFSLTCTFANTAEWPWIEMAWQKCLDDKNESLRKQGRQKIRRYHSVDLNNFRGDFEDWNGEERKEFCQKLIRVFSRHYCGYEGYLVNLEELVGLWPETKDDPLDFAYNNLLKFLMIEIGKNMTKLLPGYKMNLFHERCPYDGVFLSAFNELMNDQTFTYRNCFTTIAPMGWEDCIPLQPADLLAYENFKEGLRQLPTEKPRERRAIMSEILSIEDFVAHIKILRRDTIIELRNLYMG
jgi:hypothetical protein